MTKKLRMIFVTSISIFAIAGCATPKVDTSPIAPVQAEVIAKSMSSWDGVALPSYPAGQPEVTVLRITIQPGTKLEWHKHPVINVGVMLKGELTVETESGGELVLKTGDSIVELVDKWHRGINNGNEPVEIVVFYAGVVGAPLSVLRE